MDFYTVNCFTPFFFINIYILKILFYQLVANGINVFCIV